MSTSGSYSANRGYESRMHGSAVRSTISTSILRPIFFRRFAFSGLIAKASGEKNTGKGKNKEEESPYSQTVKLPVTEFSLRANSSTREPEIQKFWSESRVYESLLESNPGAPFTLHDGPPYANGDLHIGHALNKVLKDFINRYQLLRGKKARFIPGWDTHGLPIELKVLQSLPEAERKSLGTVELRRKATEYALKTLEQQREQFKRYGVWGDWEAPYITLQPEFEAAQLAVFGKMLLNGHIYRGRKPVHWSPSSRTALAEAELEYPEGHRSRSIYVAMPISHVGTQVPQELSAVLKDAAFAIWTTTPWTIPANLAIAVNDKLQYSVVQAEGEAAADWSSKRLVVAKDLIPRLQEKTGVVLSEMATFSGAQLEGCKYRHPLYTRESPLVIGGDYITTETGTGLVHTAPGHGQEDYLVGQRYGLELLSPVDDAGNFTEEAGEQFKGLNVQGDGNKAVIAALKDAGMLLREEQYEHKYPYDWRTKKPTIFRATSQWFASVEGFRTTALGAIKDVSWVPVSGLNRITNMTEGRSDWCISRQRKWGVPIPVFYHVETGEPLMTEESINYVISKVKVHGSDCWWTLPIEELLPPGQLRDQAREYRRGEDTMDVWFDSGSSWAGVLQTRGVDQSLNYPADLYLEGSDQHRGWFQSSLLTSVAANGVAPYKQVLTHGFVLDEKGMKMSKSLGNTVDPRVVIEGGKDQKKDPPFGADVLRLWVASADYSSDIMIGPGILKQTAEGYRKIRGTLRFLLGNLEDYNPEQHAVPYQQLPSIDRYILHKLAAVSREAESAYEGYQFSRIFQVLQRFVVSDLSNFYLDVAKDRLYIRSADAAARRSCQTVLDTLLKTLLAICAPLAPHLAEDAWLSLPYSKPSGSVFQAGWPKMQPEWSSIPEGETSLWAVAIEIREAVNATLEKARIGKAIGSSLDARVLLHVSDTDLAQRLVALEGQGNDVDDLRYLFIVSQAELISDPATVKLSAFSETFPLASSSSATSAASNGDQVHEITVGVSRAVGNKCARCWNYSELVGSSTASLNSDLCERCIPVIDELGFKAPANTSSASSKMQETMVSA
ncbi:hypothetical protein CEUSTIGMA_g1821.t1 [Chlamydomonas eustigma]|uniref:isoleucine--tRNA ligase n=1 Tax=Chlamydomonas eustigma TaxID=1157962 RepID=A0A250WU78_9CHLO|nr:hypothetical protein CEUSTIGMA_g1821.t1 [Chlamydomonas eustigma]|eukprot:GAX74373.1 hypothetical protein CEUSTIGMA_g1821.t1 [Chlamydomonas eustigma]